MREDEAAPDEDSISDFTDRPIIRAARKAEVDIFVTGDADVLESAINNPKVMKAADFVNSVIEKAIKTAETGKVNLT